MAGLVVKRVASSKQYLTKSGGGLRSGRTSGLDERSGLVSMHY